MIEMTDTEQRKTDEKYMARCIQLARNGAVGAPPNPMVGAVVVCDGRIIGEGYHRRCGGPHAEVNAINSVRDKSLLAHSTIYVSLEPCAHYGKTPPCADLIISHHIPRVVVGCRDPFARVDGLGIKKLRDAGAEVVVGVLEAECLQLNEQFMTYHGQRRPHITLKWAQSQDGYIDALRVPGSQVPPVSFSTLPTQTMVHRLRAMSMAILVGSGTALLDNPSLTTRHWNGPNPLRVVIDLQGRLSATLNVMDGSVPACVYVNEGAEPEYGAQVTVVRLNPATDTLTQIMVDLHARGVQSLLVEGGRHTLQSFIDAGLWDVCRVETAPCRLGEGVPAPVLRHCTRVEEQCYAPNRVTIYRHKV